MDEYIHRGKAEGFYSPENFRAFLKSQEVQETFRLDVNQKTDPKEVRYIGNFPAQKVILDYLHEVNSPRDWNTRVTLTGLFDNVQEVKKIVQEAEQKFSPLEA